MIGHALGKLPKDSYIQQLIELCQNDHARIEDYRERLADRVRATSNFEHNKLVNRRNSTGSSKARKYAHDCYVLHMFINGSRSKEICEIFAQGQNAVDSSQTLNITNCQTTENDENHATYTAQAVKNDIPEMITMFLNIQSDMAYIKNTSDQNNSILRGLANDFQQVTINVRHTLASVNGLRSRATDSDTVNKLQTDMTQLNSNLASMNKKVNDILVNTQDSVLNITAPSYADAVQTTCTAPKGTTKKDEERDQTTMITENTLIASSEVQDCAFKVSETCEIADTSHSVNMHTTSYNTDHISKPTTRVSDSGTINLIATVRDNVKVHRNSNTTNRYLDKTQTTSTHGMGKTRNTTTQSLKPSTPKHASAERFIAVRRKNTNSYYLGNIDPDTTDSDIYDYITTERKVKCTNINMFYGKNGSAAKVNISADFADQVESEGFWPSEITFRKWKTKSYFDRNSRYTTPTYGQQRTNYPQNSQRNRRRDNNYNKYDTYDYDDKHMSKDSNDNTNSIWRDEDDDWNKDTDRWANSNADIY